MDTSREQAAAGAAEADRSRFAVTPEALQRAAEQVATGEAELRSVSGRWSGAVVGSGGAMPEPASSTLLGDVGAALQQMLAARGRQLDDLADGLRAAAASYTANDTSASAAAGRLAGALGGHDLGHDDGHGEPTGKPGEQSRSGRGPR